MSAEDVELIRMGELQAKIADFGTLKEDFANNERTRRLCTGGYLSPGEFNSGPNVSHLGKERTGEVEVMSGGVFRNLLHTPWKREREREGKMLLTILVAESNLLESG